MNQDRGRELKIKQGSKKKRERSIKQEPQLQPQQLDACEMQRRVAEHCLPLLLTFPSPPRCPTHPLHVTQANIVWHRNNGKVGRQHVSCTKAEYLLCSALRSDCRLGNAALSCQPYVQLSASIGAGSTVTDTCASCALPLKFTDLLPLVVAVALTHSGMTLPHSGILTNLEANLKHVCSYQAATAC